MTSRLQTQKTKTSTHIWPRSHRTRMPLCPSATQIMFSTQQIRSMEIANRVQRHGRIVSRSRADGGAGRILQTRTVHAVGRVHIHSVSSQNLDAEIVSIRGG